MQTGLYAFALAAAFLGAAIYIGFVEHPARLKLGAPAMVREWAVSDHRGTMLLTALSLASAVLGFVQYRISGDVRWIVGGLTILTSWPYEYYVLVPVSIWLCAMPPEKGSAPARKLMRDWGLLELGYIPIGLAACGAFAWALEQLP
ncbi:DUF1772 domain-containing protein [Bradyrhizobium genosp. P]|uniref:DUF1772 domain-containing protein n=1 Tax=Bradyrhizobium genosp. P TaxID=83641 RepID=UPI003CF05ED7